MRYTAFGHRTGLRVSEYALGTADFGAGWGAGAEPDEARRIFDRFAEAGGAFLDSTDSYQFGGSGELTGKLVSADHEHFVLATKLALGAASRPDISQTGNSRKTMVASVEARLKRLGADYIDLLWVHFPDQLVPMGELLRGLDDLVSAGKLHHAALSDFPAWRVSRAVTFADLRNQSPIIGIQHECSLVERTADRELLPMAESLGLGAALWSPLGGGLLTGKYRSFAEGRLGDPGMVIHTESTDRRLPSSTPPRPSPRRPLRRPPRWRWPGSASTSPAPRPRWSRSSARATSPISTATSRPSTSSSPTSSTRASTRSAPCRSAYRTRASRARWGTSRAAT